MGSKQYDKYCEEQASLADDDDIPVPTTMKTVEVTYRGSFTHYTFMTEFDCKKGDRAVVFTGGNYSVVMIQKVHDTPQLTENYNYTWLVQIVDTTEYDRHIQEDGEGYDQSIRTRL